MVGFVLTRLIISQVVLVCVLTLRIIGRRTNMKNKTKIQEQ